jgi:hypothetical protein
MHTPYQLRIDIDIHGRRIIDGVILSFLRETILPDTFHFTESKAESSTRERNKKADANHPELSLHCEVVKEGRPEGAGTENQPYLKRQPSARIVGH